MSLIRKPSELEVSATVKILIYGQPGIGKTTLALSAPRPLLLDFDGGVHRVNPLHQKDTLQVKNWEEVLEVLEEDLRAYSTLIIDTAGKMLDFMNSYIIKQDPKAGKRDVSLALQGYGVRKVMFKNFLARISNMGKNVIFVAHDKEDKNGEQMIIRPEIGGSSSGDLIKELDLVGYVEASGKIRTISFDPCERFVGKNTCGLEAIMKIPVLTNSNNTFMSDVNDVYKANQASRAGMVASYDILIATIAKNVEEALTCEDCNEFLDWINTQEVIWDSKMQAATMINNKSKLIGLKFSKEAKQYEVLEVANV